jgi:tyrosine-specific transport protein
MSSTHRTGVFPTIGCILILIGTSIGAGMLAMPLASSIITFPTAMILLFCAWLVMSVTGLFMLEVVLKMPQERAHFSSMAKATAGPIGQFVAWLSTICLFYSLMSAYTAGNSSLIQIGLSQWFGWHLSSMICAIGFILVVALIVYNSMRGVDLWMRGLMSFKGAALLVMLLGLMPSIHLAPLWPDPAFGLSINSNESTLHTLKILLLATPIFLVGFGYHIVLPSFVHYIGPEPKRLRRIIWIGTTVSLVVYIIWLSVSYGVIPLNGPDGLITLHNNGDHVDQFMLQFEHVLGAVWLKWAITIFSNIAMTTSCLGVALGLFDFLADGLKRPNTKMGRLQTLLITMLPPLVVAILWPHFFLLGLSLAGLFLVILEVLLPVWMWWGARHLPHLQYPYTVRFGKTLAVFVLIVGVVFLAASLLARFA